MMIKVYQFFLTYHIERNVFCQHHRREEIKCRPPRCSVWFLYGGEYDDSFTKKIDLTQAYSYKQIEEFYWNTSKYNPFNIWHPAVEVRFYCGIKSNVIFTKKRCKKSSHGLCFNICEGCYSVVVIVVKD